jgi:hypothetical protein
MVEAGGGAKETGGGMVDIGGGAVEIGGTEADGKEPNIPETRLIGFRILPVISRSAYGWLGFGGRERGCCRGAVGAGRARPEGGGEATRVTGRS